MLFRSKIRWSSIPPGAPWSSMAASSTSPPSRWTAGRPAWTAPSTPSPTRTSSGAAGCSNACSDDGAARIPPGLAVCPVLCPGICTGRRIRSLPRPAQGMAAADPSVGRPLLPDSAGGPSPLCALPGTGRLPGLFLPRHSAGGAAVVSHPQPPFFAAAGRAGTLAFQNLGLLRRPAAIFLQKNKKMCKLSLFNRAQIG